MDTQNTENQMMEPEAAAPEAKLKSRKGLIIGGLLGLVLLAGAAFVGGRLLNNQPQGVTGPGGMMVSGSAGGGAQQAVSVEVEGAKELPEAPPNVTGIFSRREDNSVFVTSGNGEFMVMVDDTGKVTTGTEGDTQEVEVVITGDTVVYKDVTQSQFGGSPPSGGKIQQKVEPGSADEIGDNSFVTAWGERRGDRLIASVVFYSQPMIFGAPGAP